VTQKIVRHAAAAVAVCFVLPLASLAALDKPTYTERKEQVKLPNRSIEFRCAKPNSPRAPAFLVIFASGDAGLRFSSGAVYKHLAERGQYVAAYSSKEAIAQHKGGSFMTLQEAAADIAAMMHEGKRLLDLPESTPTVVTGVSRGASMVVFAAAEPTLRAGIVGGIAIALTRESDYVKAPTPDEHTPFTKLDEKGRILTYPLLDRLGSTPIAVIQSTNDEYIASKDSRVLMGPDTATRRLFEVQAKNHGFRGGQDELLRDVDLALDWITASISKGAAR
jgi:type IV secretory pathway VirJ component